MSQAKKQVIFLLAKVYILKRSYGLEAYLNLFLLSSLFLLTTTIIFSYKKTMLVYLNKGLIPFMAILFIAALIIFPKTAVSSASKGIKLWLEVVFPSLFPFFVASQLLSKSGIIRLFGVILEPVMRPLFNIPGCGSFALAMGIVSGYPVGASITADLRKEELISRVEAERLLTFTNNSGPLFIMGAVAVGMFGQASLGYLLYFSHIAACLTVGFIFRFYKRSKTGLSIKAKVRMSDNIKLEMKKLRNSDSNPIMTFGECIKNSIYTILAIGGFIIFFSVLINILINTGIIGSISGLICTFSGFLGLGPQTMDGILSGIFEITTGASLISHSSASLVVKLCSTSLVIGWAGFSVHTQVMSIISDTDIKLKPYLLGKALQGIISCFYTLLGYSLLSSYLHKESTVFATHSFNLANGWSNILKTSIQYIGISALIMILISFIYICITSFRSKKSLF